MGVGLGRARRGCPPRVVGVAGGIEESAEQIHRAGCEQGRERFAWDQEHGKVIRVGPPVRDTLGTGIRISPGPVRRRGLAGPR
jgi:hypothetical protein